MPFDVRAQAMWLVYAALYAGAMLWAFTTLLLGLDFDETPDSMHRWIRELRLTDDGFTVLSSDNGISIRYKPLEGTGICETTKGVRAYVGFIDLAPDSHTWFWFFESRSNPANDPTLLWLNGGPGSDSSIGVFQEIGPCFISPDLRPEWNAYSWTENSNLLALSQPIGVGFSYSSLQSGILNNISGVFEPGESANSGEIYPTISSQVQVSRTSEAAATTWKLIQVFWSARSSMELRTQSSQLHLVTESYGGHYGPSFWRYFKEQYASSFVTKREGFLELGSLGIINGLIDLSIQAASYPRFLRSQDPIPLNDTMLDYMEFSLNRPGGCLDYVSTCHKADRSTKAGQTICAQAALLCRADVETIYQFSNRYPYDIRQPADGAADKKPPDHFIDYLNTADVQSTLGVHTKYSMYNQEVYWSFAATGDFAYPGFLEDLIWLIDNGVEVALAYGDADYECNWLGGEDIFMAASQRMQSSASRNATDYGPFMVDDIQYGATIRNGKFSFTRVYEAGHMAPWYQPKAMKAWFDAMITGNNTNNPS